MMERRNRRSESLVMYINLDAKDSDCLAHRQTAMNELNVLIRHMWRIHSLTRDLDGIYL